MGRVEKILPSSLTAIFRLVDSTCHRYDALSQRALAPEDVRDGDGEQVAAAIDHSDIRGLGPHFLDSPESASDNGRGLVTA